MKKLTTAILGTAIAFGSVSCKKDVIGEGPVVTETRTVQSFSGIDLNMNGNVYFTKATERKLEIIAKASIHDALETSVINNRLVIRYKNGKTYDNDESIRINVSAPEINSLLLNTSGNIFCLSDIETSTLLLRTSGSGSITLKNITATSIDAESAVSGKISAANGTAQSEKLKTNASGEIDLSAIGSKTASVTIIGSGDIKVKVSENLDATIKGSGSVYYIGYPFVSTYISGTGRVLRF